jgi:hypothetical protein
VFSFQIFTFLAHPEAAGQVGPAQGCSQMKGNWSLAQDVCTSALELSMLLEALKARQRSIEVFTEGFKKDLSMLGSNCVVFWEHQEYIPCNSHPSPSFEAEVMNVDNLKSAKTEKLRDKQSGKQCYCHTCWYQFKQAEQLCDCFYRNKTHIH